MLVLGWQQEDLREGRVSLAALWSNADTPALRRAAHAYVLKNKLHCGCVFWQDDKLDLASAKANVRRAVARFIS